MITKLSSTLICLMFLATAGAQSSSTKSKFVTEKGQYMVDRDWVVKSYADSINRVSTVTDIPAFVFNECLEYDPLLRKHFSSSESIRWRILKKVTNKNALSIILQAQDERLKARCDAGAQELKFKIDHSASPFYDLVQKRFNSLK